MGWTPKSMADVDAKLAENRIEIATMTGRPADRIMAVIESRVDRQVATSAVPLSRAEAMTRVVTDDPDLYDRWRQAHQVVAR